MKATITLVILSAPLLMKALAKAPLLKPSETIEPELHTLDLKTPSDDDDFSRDAFREELLK